ncbi:MAG TPA: hypothetical protein VFY56_01580 [Propionibacteriaceae bacterium]|nr:hypothetical protein [Propionibacteriaceae bacterium]
MLPQRQAGRDLFWWLTRLGLSWQHTRGSALLGFVNQDAAYLADQTAAHYRAGTRPETGVAESSR